MENVSLMRRIHTNTSILRLFDAEKTENGQNLMAIIYSFFSQFISGVVWSLSSTEGVLSLIVLVVKTQTYSVEICPIVKPPASSGALVLANC